MKNGQPQTPEVHAAREIRASYIHHIIRQGKAELRISDPISVFHHLPSVGPKQLCALAQLGCTHKQSHT